MLRSAQLWLPAYLRRQRMRPPVACRHLFLCICDHFEPCHNTDKAGAMKRVMKWVKEFPKLADRCFQTFGHKPRHTFFFPIEQYDPDLLNPLKELCRANLAELEIHLHHTGDTPENLRNTLETAKAQLSAHGFLSKDPKGAIKYAFVHGNWALANPHKQGRNCGVNNELEVLHASGCYADFTMPAAPHPAQSRVINSIYYPAFPSMARAHDRGIPAAVLSQNQTRPNSLLLVQGPLMLDWHRRKFGLLPRIENSDLSGNRPPTLERLALWLKAGIHVKNKPDWRFVKLHTHGCDEARGNIAMLLGEPMRSFYASLETFRKIHDLRIHLVAARELANIVRAAEEGCTGEADKYRDYWLKKNET